MTYSILIAFLALALSAIMAFAWVVAGRTGQSGWVDAIWSFAVGGAGVAAALTPVGDGGAPTVRQGIVASLAAIWALRLGLHIARRTIGGADDPRYAQLRREWGAAFRRKLFWFLQVQAVAAFLLVLSILVAARNPASGLRLGDWLGILVLITSVAGEAAADRQLTRFRANPANKGRVCDVGLWALSRHPNYFFEWLGWLAYPAIAIDPTGTYGFGWIALIGPAFMYWLLVHVSGLPPLEAHMLRSRGDAFRAYQARVNGFWPGLPRPATLHRQSSEVFVSLIASAIRSVERTELPDPVTRLGIDLLVGRTRRQLAIVPAGEERDFVRAMSVRPIAEYPEAANNQHYELPPSFFELTLGPRRKYSCCLYERGTESLGEAELRALKATVAHADLADGQRILELGCGWGSLTLFMAELYPGRQDRRGFQFQSSASPDRVGGRGAWLCQCDRTDRGHERIRAGRNLRAHRVGGDVRTYVQLAGASRPGSVVARTRRPIVSACLYAQKPSLPIRPSERVRLDRAAFLHRRDHAEPRPDPSFSRLFRRGVTNGAGAAAITPRPRSTGLPISTRTCRGSTVS